MKLIIDIPELTYDRLLNEQHIPNMDYEYLIIHGTPIPDNATNGQVIQTLFKPNRVERTGDYVIVENYDFNEEWWNSPYQKGGK